MKAWRTTSPFEVLCVLVFLVGTGPAESRTGAEEVGERRGVANPAGWQSAGDGSPHFPIARLRITGNTLLSTDELLEKLPADYHEYELDPASGEIRRDAAGKLVIKESYDLRPIAEIYARPGPLREVSLQTMLGLTKYVLSRYENQGYRGIYVYVPPKAMIGQGRFVDDTLWIQVLEARVGRLEVKRYNFERNESREGYLRGDLLRFWSPIKEGQTIRKQRLDNFVDLLNLNPDRHVAAVVSRADEPNALDLTYEVYEESPWHVYVQADDSGTRRRQWAPRVGVINTNLGGFDDRLFVQYQAPWEKGIEDQYAVFGTYDVPLYTPRLRLTAYGGYSEFDIAAEGIGFLGNGSLFGGILSYNIAQVKGWFLDLTGSLARESSKVTPSLEIGSDVEMDLWGLGIRVHHRNGGSRSDTSVALNWTQSMGGSSEDAFDEARLDADPDFAIFSLSAAHTQYVDPNRLHRIKASCRIIEPDGRLVPAKMTAFGGLYTVRGYEEDEIIADGGILLSGQYEFDVWSWWRPREEEGRPRSARDRASLQRVAPLAFVDVGRARIEDPVPGEEPTQNLASVGVGLLVETRGHFQGALYYGWPLRATEETDEGDGRLNVSLTYKF